MLQANTYFGVPQSSREEKADILVAAGQLCQSRVDCCMEEVKGQKACFVAEPNVYQGQNGYGALQR